MNVFIDLSMDMYTDFGYVYIIYIYIYIYIYISIGITMKILFLATSMHISNDVTAHINVYIHRYVHRSLTTSIEIFSYISMGLARDYSLDVCIDMNIY